MVHDACGVGFIARTTSDDSRDRRIVALGLEALRRLTHRGASAELGAVDGCGVLTDIPWPLIADAMGGRLPMGRTRALGMLFVHPSDRAAATAIVENELCAAGASTLRWRTLPTSRLAVLRGQRQTTPKVLQVAMAFGDGQKSVDSALYRARLRIEHAARDAGVRLTIASLSTRTVVYKALVTPQALDSFYLDLADARFTSRFIVFHQRFSTNTTADWALAQPFRSLAHNGEINTINGNRLWMHARIADTTALPGFAEERPISTDGSDSKTLDDAIELMRHEGYSTAHALARLVPPAWERDHDLPPDVRAFYEFQSLLSEPWDGPSALVYSDGRHVGAAMDRNGFRPARVVTTTDGLIAVASEAGVLPADEHDILSRGRLGPGDMIDLDLERGVVRGTNEIRRRLAFRRRYRRLVEEVVVPLPPSPDSRPEPRSVAAPLSQRQTAFGCSREEVDLILKAMLADGHEAVGSMGDDAPPAVLSARSRLFTDFFRQRFAQVTNPPVDPYREASVMSLTTLLGAHGTFLDELAPRPPRLALRSPILTGRQLADLRAAHAFAPVTIEMLFSAAAGAEGLRERLDAISEEVCHAVERGSAVVVLSDRGVSAGCVPVPSLLAVAAAHRALIRRGLRMRASLVVEAGDARDPHQISVLFAFGAAAVCPSLAFEIVAGLAADDETGCDLGRTRYRLAVERGLRTIMSKMGVCTFSGYCGAQLFEILGLDAAIVDEFFPGTASPVGGLSLADVAATIVERHRRAFLQPTSAAEYPGLHGYRRDGEYHATNPVVVRSLQRARDEALAGTASVATGSESSTAYDTFKSHVYNRPPSAIRDFLTFASATPIPIADVESEDAICRRFFASAMSVGALSPEAHRTIARAMNRLGGRSNSGEGGEEPDRFGHPDGNRTKQVASARFGVTPGYLRSADELQIKIAQGSKPGEGGQLPAMKVVPHIARLRHAQPGTTLISPPVHHDIYSIEDLAELIYDLRQFHPTARINVKLVASVGVGIIAAGVVKAGAGAIQISGHDGGTGASPRASIKHAGMPWEIGLSEAHRVLTDAGLRDRVVLQTDGGLKTGRDIAIAAALGADEYGFGTAALVSIGCVMARQCHMNTCPVGIATQREDLRGTFSGTPEMLIGYLRLVAGEVREILASLGLRRLSALVGRSDLVRVRENVSVPIVLEPLLRGRRPNRRDGPGDRSKTSAHAHRIDPGPSPDVLENVGPAHPLLVSGPIANTDRAFGAAVAGAIAARHGDAGLPDGSVRMTMTGSAGQSFGAFSLPGMQLSVVGDANDGLGKGMHGGELIIAPAARERGRTAQVLAGNAALYGATGGRVFIAGAAGERFAIRNSGATAVVEGVGDHACEYMTGGTVVILGPIGRNFAAGMTGGVAYVTDDRRVLSVRSNPEQLSVEPLAPADLKIVRNLLETHARLTGSRAAKMMLRNDRSLSTFRRVTSAAAPAVQVLADAEAPAVNQ